MMADRYGLDLHARLRIMAAVGFVALSSAFVAGAVEPGGRWDGLCGENLKRAVEADCRPVSYLTRQMGEGGLQHVMMQTDVSADGLGYLNRFSDETLGFPPSLDEGTDAVFVSVVHPWWWDVSDDARRNVGYDLYNLYPAPLGVQERKMEFPPGTVTDPDFSNGFWSVGTGVFDGTVCDLWQPPSGYEGDVARVVFYLMTVYPRGLKTFGGFADQFLVDGYYPGLSDAAVRQLLAWHRNDPADDLERGRNAVFAGIQGNVNPFVEMAALADHIWGERKAVPMGTGSGDDGSEKVPLKSVYSLAEERIELSSPYVPAGALWTVDGVRVDVDFLVPSQLGVGVHELRFEADVEFGKLLIEILP